MSLCRLVQTIVIFLAIVEGLAINPNTPVPPKNLQLATKCCPEPNILQQSEACPRSVNLNCSFGQYMIDPYRSATDAFDIEEDGTLNVDNGSYQIPKAEYCIGLRSPSPGDLRYVALSCFEDSDIQKSKFDLMGSFIFISVIFIGLTLYVYRLIVLRDTQDLVTKYALICLFIFFLTLGLVQFFTELLIPISACTILAIVIHFFMIAYFTWINCVMANVWKSVVVPRWSINEATWYRWNHIYAWSIPTLIECFVLFGHFSEHPVLDAKIGSVSCWFASPKHALMYQYLPISIILAINLVLFIWTCIVLSRHAADFNLERRKSLKYRVCMYLKLFLLVGLSWILEVMSVLAGEHLIWFIFDVINAFHGFLIFLVLVVFRSRVKRELAGKQICYCFRAPDHWRHNVDIEHQRFVDNEDDEGTIPFRNNPNSVSL